MYELLRLTKEENKKLCEEYPFLIPRNRFSDMLITEADKGGFWPGSPDVIPEYDYDFTELDDLPTGWRLAFGEQLCAELKKALEEDGLMDRYRITQIKEKYGRLCWYDYGGSKKTRDIIRKYEKLSVQTCICCGKPATKITIDWISPFCDEDIPIYNGKQLPSVPIHEYYDLDKFF